MPRVRVVLCTSGGHPGRAVLARLLGSPRVSVAAILLSTRVFHPRCGLLRGAWRHARASGLRYALYLARAAAPPLRAPGIPVIRGRDFNRDEARARIEGLAPELLVSAFFNQRIGEPLARVPRHGAVNIHPSMLPALKGVDPVFYARLHGDAALGVSVHRVSPQFDAGNLLAQRAFPVDPGESVLGATTRLYGEGAALLLDSLDAIEAGAPGTPQSGAGSYHSWPDRAQVAALLRMGVRLV